MELLQAFGFWFAVVAPASLLLFAATGTWLTWLNRRNEPRRIQRRSGEHRIWKDIRSSVVELTVSAALFAAGLALRSEGYVLVTPYEGLIATVVGFGLLLVAYDAWFYWTHRLLHTKWFYRFHAPHHRAVAPTAWSNDAGSSVDTTVAQGFFLLASVLTPAPLVALFAHRAFDQVTGMIGHCGFEHFAGRTMRWPWPMITTIYHDQHHSSFRYNYANYFSWWDRMLGTIHPKYDAYVRDREEALRDAEAPAAPEAAR